MFKIVVQANSEINNLKLKCLLFFHLAMKISIKYKIKNVLQNPYIVTKDKTTNWSNTLGISFYWSMIEKCTSESIYIVTKDKTTNWSTLGISFYWSMIEKDGKILIVIVSPPPWQPATDKMTSSHMGFKIRCHLITYLYMESRQETVSGGNK